MINNNSIATWAEPFSALYWRIRFQSYLLAIAFIVIAVLGLSLYKLATNATALVYVVGPEGNAAAISNNETTRAPNASESIYVAKNFIELLYGFNSSTIHQDLAQAIGMCSAAMGKQLRQELADVQFLNNIRERGIRSETEFTNVELLEHERRHAQVRVKGLVKIFPITDYEGNPIEIKPIDITVIMSVVPRDPEKRLNGLEIVRLVHNKPEVKQ